MLVSGAGSGIGKAIAIQCARLGARLAICGRKVERLEETAILRGLGAEVMVRPATIRDAEDVDRLHAEVWERFVRQARPSRQQCRRPVPAGGHRLFGERLERRHRHQSQRHLVHDAGSGAELARSRPARLHRQHRHRRLAGHAGRRPHLRGAGGGHLPVEDGRHRMGAARHPHQLRRPWRHRHRGHGRLLPRKPGASCRGPTS